MGRVFGEQAAGRLEGVAAERFAQGLGAAITYARRYGLAAAFGLWQTDNDNPASDAPAIPLNQPKKRFNSAGAVVQQEKPIENTAVTPDVTPVTAKPEVVTAKPEPVVSNEPAFDYQNNEHRALLTKAVKASGLTAQQLTPVRSFFTEGKWKEAAVPTNPDKLCAFLKEIAG